LNVSKPPAKTAPKAAAKSVPKAAPKPASATKPVAKATAKAPAKAPVKTPAKTAVVPTPADKKPSKPAAKAAVPASTKTATDKASKAAPVAKTPTAAAAPAAPDPNRFADRFGPAKVTAPTHHVPMDPVKIKADPKTANAWKTKAGRDLTEAELLAMPESEYMNDKQIDYFRAILQGQKDDLLSNAGETTEHLREDTSIVPDPADRATIEEEHALELRTRDRERKLLKKISQALGRLETGEYGFCDETGEPIGLARLLARPTATLSLEAQQRRELKQKMFGD
jgi:DnaK suppressor protein